MTDEELCEKYDCVLECESPLEISAKGNVRSRATGIFATLVIEQMRKQLAKEQRADRRRGATK